MKDVSIVYSKKAGSKRDIDIKYLQEQLSGFFHNDPLTYCNKSLPVKIDPKYAPEGASWLPESVTNIQTHFPEDYLPLFGNISEVPEEEEKSIKHI